MGDQAGKGDVGMTNSMAAEAQHRLQHIHALTPERWPDFEALFGESQTCSSCWCMWWRLSRAEFEAGYREGNRRAMKAIVDAGRVPGLLGYRDGRAVAWCSVGPRDEFASLNRSPVLKRLDDAATWSIVCFFVSKRYRQQKITHQLIESAAEAARREGAEVVEAYPTVPREGRVAAVSSYMGLPSMFAAAGFTEVARPSKSKVVMRRYL